MRPTFMGFETAKSSIFTNQKALDIVGNNLANIDTNGYTRQRVETVSVSASSHASRIASNRIGLTGQGVEAMGVSQMRDSFLDKRFRDEYSVTSYHGKAANILGDIQSALGDGFDITSSSDLLSGIQQIWESIADFRQEPTADTQANLIMSAFRNMTQILQQLDTKLTGVTQQQTFDMGVEVDRVNDIAVQLAELNEKISTDSTVLSDQNNEHYRPNELYDQRNVLLDELSGYGNVGITELANGMVNVTLGGNKFVTGLEHNKLALNQNKDQTVSLKWLGTGEDIRLTSGSLKASIEFINGRGNNVQNSNEGVEKGIPYYRDRLDTFAKALAELSNNIIPEKTYLDGAAVLYDANGTAMIDEAGNRTYKILEEDLIDNTDPAKPVTIALKGSYVSAADPKKVIFAKQADGTFVDPNALVSKVVAAPSTSPKLLDANGKPVLYAGGKAMVDKNNKPTLMASEKGSYVDKNKKIVHKGDYVDADGNLVYGKNPGTTDWVDKDGNPATEPTTTHPGAKDAAGNDILYDYKGEALVDKDNKPTAFENTKAEYKDENGNTVKPGDYVDAKGNVLFWKSGDPGHEVWNDKPVPKVVAEPAIKYKTLLSNGSDTNLSNQVDAGNISLSKNWNDGGAGYFISNKNLDASKYAQQLAVALTSQDYTFNSFGERFTGTFEEYVKDYVEKLGADVKYQGGRQEATGKVADDFISRRDQISGVSRDEETANMLMFQKSYEASARMMTTLDDLLDVVINRMGRVGL